MNMKEHRVVEEKKMEALKDPKEQKSNEISRLIDKTLASKHKVYLATDWHLYVGKEKNKPECHRCKNFKDIVKNVNEVMGKDDMLIYLGDLCDGEMENEKDEMKSILSTIPGHKVLVLGNNDLFTPAFYKACGFEYVTQSFEWNDMLFTHVPCKNDNKLNIHGHIHGYKTYWIPYSNQIDVAALDGRVKPVELKTVIASQPSYAKTIKEDPSHFDEGYTNTIEGCVSLFESVFEPSYLKPDPFPTE